MRSSRHRCLPSSMRMTRVMRKMRSSQVSTYRQPKVRNCEITATLWKKKEKTFWLVTWRCWSYMDCFGLSEPPPITEGVFVWHKLRSYPFWPALVGALLVMSCGVKSWLDHKISIIGKFCKQVSLFCNSAGEKCESQAEKSKRVVNWWLDTFQKQRVGNFLSFNSLNAQIVYVIAYQRNIASTVVLQSAHWPQH